MNTREQDPRIKHPHGLPPLNSILSDQPSDIGGDADDGDDDSSRTSVSTQKDGTDYDDEGED